MVSGFRAYRINPAIVKNDGWLPCKERDEAARQLMDDAMAVEQAGAFALVLECIPASLAQQITAALSIPTVGIGAGVGCDAQVLVISDLLGVKKHLRDLYVHLRSSNLR